MSAALAHDLAVWLDAQHCARETFRSHGPIKSGGLDFAYDVQDELVALRAASSGQNIAGYKIGLTTPRMQEMCGLNHPIAGFVLSGGVQQTPARLDTRNFVRLGLECEIAVRLARQLDGRGGAPEISDIAASIGEIAAAFEIIEDRAADYKSLDMPSLVADNSWNAGIVLGKSVPLCDLADIPGRLSINGAANDGGSTRDVLGHPLNSVRWLCEHLARRNARIESGQWIMTGTIVPTRFPQARDVYQFEVEGLPPVCAAIL